MPFCFNIYSRDLVHLSPPFPVLSLKARTMSHPSLPYPQCLAQKQALSCLLSWMLLLNLCLFLTREARTCILLAFHSPIYFFPLKKEQENGVTYSSSEFTLLALWFTGMRICPVRDHSLKKKSGCWPIAWEMACQVWGFVAVHRTLHQHIIAAVPFLHGWGHYQSSLHLWGL